MASLDESPWIPLEPPLRNARPRRLFAEYARTLIDAAADTQGEDDAIEDVRRAFVRSTKAASITEKPLLLAAGLVLTDLVVQGWQLRVRRGAVQVRPHESAGNDRAVEKQRIKHQELVKRDAQLRQPAVQRFLREMERPRVFEGRFTSVFSLMRDGRELTEVLRKAREHSNNGWAGELAKAVDPYLEFVRSEESACSFTGLRLMDVWRYFRHTWTNQYTSVPGRSMVFLVRDRAAACHPVVGIGALSSPVMQIRERDTWIGWHPDAFLARVKSEPTTKIAKWLVDIVDTAVEEVFVEDFLEDGLLTARQIASPDDSVVERLFKEAAEQRRQHHRYDRARDHKASHPSVEAERWTSKARTHLFRSKRALALASYLQARSAFNVHFKGSPTGAKLAELAATGRGSDIIRKILKKAKGDRLGIAVADITVCGAVQPYNAILGGKLVAMLATSPEVILEYRRRYAEAESEIASSMAGRAIIRKPTLVLLGTTSLYGTGSSQYNRIKIPCNRLGGADGDVVSYAELGHSEAFGTSQYSEETLDALSVVVQQSTDGQRVNSIFGEGVSPKLRKVRQGLDLLNFPSDHLLKHHRRRIVYAISLVRNLPDYLLGLDAKPRYLMPIDDGPEATAKIAGWWRERWLRGRIGSDQVLDEVARHTLVRPVRHGARVTALPPRDQRVLFPDYL